jgi:hypothetical protein
MEVGVALRVYLAWCLLCIRPERERDRYRLMADSGKAERREGTGIPYTAPRFYW